MTPTVALVSTGPIVGDMGARLGVTARIIEGVT
jgi:hypothetical protein